MPGAAVTDADAQPPLTWAPRRTTWAPDGVLAMASMPLRIRLRSTCSSIRRSARTAVVAVVASRRT